MRICFFFLLSVSRSPTPPRLNEIQKLPEEVTVARFFFSLLRYCILSPQGVVE